ncbi:hypothetical protein M413DRAFT_29312 [Hebeloma cylindrosporum]|uniref:Uncharacterized protein n=1 Tax=Hebeloma cylindrosporum TaxID=76867 RepID=A0A0C2YF34_HEBCY|nr:hypothetical protein M413DRAFT_29312 [Hebeloma cylindrosporum h7]
MFQLQALIKDEATGYFKPISTTSLNFDTLLYQPEFPNFLKMTVGVDRLGNPAGFDRIERWLNLLKGPDYIAPSETRRWRLIFIVPEEIAASFKPKQFGKALSSKIEQYVHPASGVVIWELVRNIAEQFEGEDVNRELEDGPITGGLRISGKTTSSKSENKSKVQSSSSDGSFLNLSVQSLSAVGLPSTGDLLD